MKTNGTKAKDVILEYFNFLYEKEYIFFCDSEEELVRFPKMSLEWNVPFQVTNAIIDIKDNTIFDFENIVNQLNDWHSKLYCGYKSNLPK